MTISYSKLLSNIEKCTQSVRGYLPWISGIVTVTTILLCMVLVGWFYSIAGEIWELVRWPIGLFVCALAYNSVMVYRQFKTRARSVKTLKDMFLSPNTKLGVNLTDQLHQCTWDFDFPTKDNVYIQRRMVSDVKFHSWLTPTNVMAISIEDVPRIMGKKMFFVFNKYRSRWEQLSRNDTKMTLLGLENTTNRHIMIVIHPESPLILFNQVMFLTLKKKTRPSTEDDVTKYLNDIDTININADVYADQQTIDTGALIDALNAPQDDPRRVVASTVKDLETMMLLLKDEDTMKILSDNPSSIKTSLTKI